MQCVCSSFFGVLMSVLFCFLKTAREYLCQGASVTVGRVHVTHLSFGMILKQMLQVLHRQTWTLDQRKCEIFKLFFRLR